MASNGSDARRAVVGLTTYLQRTRSGPWDVEASFLPRTYLDSVLAAGGLPVLLPPQDSGPTGVGKILGRLDALVLTGGGDVDPARYGSGRHQESDDPDCLRDTWELTLVAAALQRRLPFLAICRGAQLVNVALGGTLFQHLPDRLGHTDHRHRPAMFSDTQIRAAPRSRLAAIRGEAFLGRCSHHQGIDRLGRGLVVSATCDDGTIEAVEVAAHPFGLAVQWHPEESSEDVDLFAALVAAARGEVT